MISILVLTLNEEQNLATCLKALSWSDDIVVLDSYSTDRTLEIAHEFGARIVQREFDNWSTHQNWALENIAFKHPWVYYSDADEIVSTDLRDEMLRVTVTNTSVVAYRVRYKNFFCGRWIRHCGIYPVWVLRLFRPDRIRWDRVVNPTPITDGPTGRLVGHFHHYSFNKGLDAWFDKHNKYSHGEAIETIRSLERSSFRWVDLFSYDSADRRRATKELSFRMPMRPTLRFLYMYVLKLGFLDGAAGYKYCRLLAIYEYMIVLKVDELRRREKGLTM